MLPDGKQKSPEERIYIEFIVFQSSWNWIQQQQATISIQASTAQPSTPRKKRSAQSPQSPSLTPGGSGVHRCGDCKKSFSSSQALQGHVAARHSSRRQSLHSFHQQGDIGRLFKISIILFDYESIWIL
jgi:hypothetical protein